MNNKQALPIVALVVVLLLGVIYPGAAEVEIEDQVSFQINLNQQNLKNRFVKLKDKSSLIVSSPDSSWRILATVSAPEEHPNHLSQALELSTKKETWKQEGEIYSGPKTERHLFDVSYRLDLADLGDMTTKFSLQYSIKFTLVTEAI